MLEPDPSGQPLGIPPDCTGLAFCRRFRCAKLPGPTPGTAALQPGSRDSEALPLGSSLRMSGQGQQAGLKNRRCSELLAREVRTQP